MSIVSLLLIRFIKVPNLSEICVLCNGTEIGFLSQEEEVRTQTLRIVGERFDEKNSQALIKEETRHATGKPSRKMASSHVSVHYHLHSVVKVLNHGSWMIHVLSERNKHQRFYIAASILLEHQATRLYKERTRLKFLLTPITFAWFGSLSVPISFSWRGVWFNNDMTCLYGFFESKPNDFYRISIEHSVDCMQQVVKYTGEFIEGRFIWAIHK